MAYISVIIPLFNQERYIEAAVESVLKQTCQNLEVIIVDDHSRDRSFEIASGFQQRYGQKVKVLRNRKNCGVSFSRNKGVRNAQGGYLAFLDADDIWYPTKIEKQFERLVTDPHVGLVHTGVITIADPAAQNWLASGDDKTAFTIDHWDKAFNGFCQKAGQFNGNDYFFSLLEYNGICTSSVMVRREYFNKAGGFVTELPFQVEDWLQWLKMSMISKIAPIKERLTGYRFHTESHTAKHFVKADFDFADVRKQIRRWCQSHNPRRFRELIETRDSA